MEAYELKVFAENLEKIESYLSELASREEEIRLNGLHGFAQSTSTKGILPYLKAFPVEFADLMNMARYTDKLLFDGIRRVAEESKLETFVLQVVIRLQIAQKKDPNKNQNNLKDRIKQMARSNPGKRNPLFEDESLPWESALTGIARLNGYVKRLLAVNANKFKGDSEVFKPSKIDQSIVLEHMEQAVEHIKEASGFNEEDRVRLITYLEETKFELSRKKPSWRKVAGGLLILSVVLGGFRIAPQAYDNVNRALTYILGNSVERHIQLNLPEPEDEFKQMHTGGNGSRSAAAGRVPSNGQPATATSAY